MTRHALGIRVVAILLSFSLHQARADAAPASLTVVWIDLVGLPSMVRQAAAQELRSTLATAGVEVLVRSGPADAVLTGDEIAVVLVPRAAPARAHGGTVLGAVLRDAPQRRTAWIHVPAVLETLGLAGVGGPASPLEQRHTAVALGRVAAHELVHLIVPGRSHARSGLMAPSLDRSALTAPSATLDIGTREAVCASLTAGSRAPVRQAWNPLRPRT